MTAEGKRKAKLMITLGREACILIGKWILGKLRIRKYTEAEILAMRIKRTLILSRLSEVRGGT